MCPVSAGGSLPVAASGGAAALIPASGIWSLTEISADGPSSSPGLRAPISCLRNAPIAIRKAAQTTSGGVSTAKSPNTPRPPSRQPLASRQPLVRPPWLAPVVNRGRLLRIVTYRTWHGRAGGGHAELRIRRPAWQYRTLPVPRTLDRADLLVPRRPAHPLQVLPGLQPGLRP